MLLRRPYLTCAELRERLTAALGVLPMWRDEIEAALRMPDTPESAKAWSILVSMMEDEYRERNQMPAKERRLHVTGNAPIVAAPVVEDDAEELASWIESADLPDAPFRLDGGQRVIDTEAFRRSQAMYARMPGGAGSAARSRIRLLRQAFGKANHSRSGRRAA